jgi:hypothetical protein
MNQNDQSTKTNRQNTDTLRAYTRPIFTKYGDIKLLTLTNVATKGRDNPTGNNKSV